MQGCFLKVGCTAPRGVLIKQCIEVAVTIKRLAGIVETYANNSRTCTLAIMFNSQKLILDLSDTVVAAL